MGLDEATRRFAFLLQRDLRRFAEKRTERESRGEDVKYDSIARLATCETRRGDVVLRLYGEPLATYATRDRILRWAWVGRAPSSALTFGDVIFREGQARGVPQLAMSVVGDLDAEDARTLVTLGALVSRAESLHERKVGGDIQFVGLFDRPRPSDDPPAPSRISVPPPPVVETAPARDAPPPPPAYRSLPPIREIYEPRTTGSYPPRAAVRPASRPAPSESDGRARPSSSPPVSARLRQVREPSRTIFLPVATAAVSALTSGSKGFVQGLFVVSIDRENPSEKRRVAVQLVVVDVAGILRALDPPAALVDAAVEMIEADYRDGNGLWRKLSARISPKPDGGATLNVEVL